MNMWKHTLLSLFLLLNITPASADPVELDRVVAIVNDGVILQSDISNALKTLTFNARQKHQSLPDETVLKEQVLEKLLLDTIQQQEADRIGVRIDDNRLDDAINNIAKENGQTLEAFQAELATSGISYETFREEIRQEMAISEVRNAMVRRRINIIPAEVDNLATLLANESNSAVQYHIQHIQLRFDNGTDKEAVARQAEKIAAEVEKGSDFSEMAITYSKGPKALSGGDWGWMRKEEMPTIFADQITTQSKGAIIGPFRSGVGFHILKITDVKGLETVAVTEVNARHILLKTSVIMSDEGAQRLLKEITDKINNGNTTFADMALQYSQDPGSASQKGELGYQTPDLYVPEFKHQIETLPVRKISEPFKTVHGWHIVEVLDRRQVDKTDSALKNKAYRILFNRKFNEEAGTWIQEMRAGAFVELVESEAE
ncbi:peptidylprolyl isomerase SurA [Vibrio sp. HA2012]|uniref:peptidylprolyl isomerase SurA n=1 Tax=Vibrio sp. HA2012 TaxID=1971595 RepID=UPI000C2BE799|nr:peptidylprolyl isomerase SurA [Vibrio sp. HA2012]PJC85825.1 peptidylprolyl isomerase SurA [Vibrio sp. HA2012]